MTDIKYWVGFNIVPGIGPARLQKLLDHFGDAESAWHAAPLELARAGLDRKSLQNLLAMRGKLDLDAEMRRIEDAGAHVLTLQDENYPRLLRQIHLPPPVLYVRGSCLPEDEWAIAVVGTRRAKAYGREVTRYLAGGLARNGITVVSGMARGIDSQAHRTALEAGGRTIAVLGSGIDIIYPHENVDLAQDIVNRGALMTEYPLGTKPDRRNFPPRNRIISGLTLGTLVTQAGEGSGALITAYFALEQGREVFAVPGSLLDRGSSGTNRLIQQGEAKLVLNVEDILEELNLTMVSQQAEVRAVVPENQTEALLLKHLSEEPVHVDELGRASGLPIAQVSGTLALMELKGLVRQMGAMNYVLAREGSIEYVVD
ncbi:MAG: DNA processing protein DprA [Anaerolineae bacterium SM23_84]|jgi:DNA processing protein|nr:MAG: DNA processing protein DprA [Anaerolineae bacterium SM23_84]